MSTPEEESRPPAWPRQAVLFVQMERGADRSWQEFRGYFLEIRIRHEQCTSLTLTMTVEAQVSHPDNGTPCLTPRLEEA